MVWGGGGGGGWGAPAPPPPPMPDLLISMGPESDDPIGSIPAYIRCLGWERRSVRCICLMFDVLFLVAQTDPYFPYTEMSAIMTQDVREREYEVRNQTSHVWTFKRLFCVD